MNLKILDLLISAAIVIVIALMSAALLYKYCSIQPWVLGIALGFIGLALYVSNAVLIRAFILKRAPDFANDTLWALTAGTGIVPKWVSFLGLMSMPVFIAAAIWLFVWYWPR